MATVVASGTKRQSSTAALAHRRWVGGRNVRRSSTGTACRRSFTGGLPSQDDPAFDFLGAADSTATRASRGTERPPAAIPELPRNARFPTFAGRIRSQPPLSS